jgi:hypothetical protein
MFISLTAEVNLAFRNEPSSAMMKLCSLTQAVKMAENLYNDPMIFPDSIQNLFTSQPKAILTQILTHNRK